MNTIIMDITGLIVSNLNHQAHALFVLVEPVRFPVV